MSDTFSTIRHHILCKCRKCHGFTYDENAVISSRTKIDLEGNICDLKCVSYEEFAIRVYYTTDNPNLFQYGDFAMPLEKWNELDDYQGG